MTITTDAALAARLAAAEAARRAAEAAARRAAEAAALRAAEAQQAELAEQTAPAVQVAPADELSTGRGSSAVLHALSVTGADGAPAQLDSAAPAYSVTELQQGAVSLPTRTIEPDGPGSANPEEVQVSIAALHFGEAVEDEDPLDAAQALTAALEELPAELRGDFLAESADSLEQLTEELTDLDEGETAEVVEELARAAEVAGPLHVEELTRPLARAIADGRLEQTGGDENAGPFGIIQGVKTHNSEREFVDGIGELDDSGSLFRDALASSLQAESEASSGDRADRALGFAAAVANEDTDLVPDDGFWRNVLDFPGAVLDTLQSAVERIDELREAAADEVLDLALGLSESIESLEPGDSLTLGAGGEVSFELHAELENQLRVTRNEDGTYTVAGASDVLVGLGVADNRLTAGGGATVEFTFDSEEDAIDGAQSLAKLALTGLLPPIAGLSAPSLDELENLQSSVSAVQLSNELSGELDGRFGLTGLQSGGAEGELATTYSARIELEDGLPSAVVLEYEISAEAAAEANDLAQRFAGDTIPDDELADFEDRYGFNPYDVNGIAKADGSITVQVRTPIETSPVEGGNVLDQVSTLLAHPEQIIGGAPEVSIEVKGTAQANGAGIEGSITLDGLDLADGNRFIRGLAQGDLEAAVASTGAELTLGYRTFEDESRGWLDHGLDIGVAALEGENVVRHYGETHDIAVRPNGEGTGLEVG